jgi:hypothetical protein
VQAVAEGAEFAGKGQKFPSKRGYWHFNGFCAICSCLQCLSEVTALSERSHFVLECSDTQSRTSDNWPQGVISVKVGETATTGNPYLF